MYVKEALRHFKSRPGIIKALGGARHRSAVYQWKPDGLVPLGAALILSTRMGKELDLSLYDRYQEKRNRQLARARAARHR